MRTMIESETEMERMAEKMKQVMEVMKEVGQESIMTRRIVL